MKHDLHVHDDAQSQMRRGVWVLAGFLLVGAFFLWTEHRAHLFGILPYLLVLACPLMHLFHHHGHSQRRHDEQETLPSDTRKES